MQKFLATTVAALIVWFVQFVSIVMTAQETKNTFQESWRIDGWFNSSLVQASTRVHCSDYLHHQKCNKSYLNANRKNNFSSFCDAYSQHWKCVEIEEITSEDWINFCHDYPQHSKCIKREEIAVKKSYQDAVRKNDFTNFCQIYPQQQKCIEIRETNLQKTEKKFDVRKNPLLDYKFWQKATVQEVAKILDNGANIKARDGNGLTPLHMAAAWNKIPEVVALLLNRGANIEARTKGGSTPLYQAAGFGTVGVVLLLLDRGANIEARNELGHTPLHGAAAGSSSAIVKLLLDRGANGKAQGNDGRTPFHLAEYTGYLKESDVYWQLNEAQY